MNTQVRVWKDVDHKDSKAMKSIFGDIGVETEIELTSYGTIQEMVIKKGNRILRFGSGFKISELQKNTVERYRVAGTLRCLPVEKDFEHKSEARNFIEELTADLSADSFNLEISTVQVEQ